jgi:glyoxylase-like metal-dependent hydrolase (beta-lactamase superfamily II)/rhodanese-related sulfurtransferase
MYVEQIYTTCLAEASYFVENNGEALVIDPIRDIDIYLKKAEERNARIKYVLETHFHADFISGHVELARKTGATVVFGPTASTGFMTYVASDGEFLHLGNLKIKVLHTPGHTPESTCYLLFDEKEYPHAIFTGDTLFIGDVGRPDLAIKSTLSVTDLAGMLYDSLQNKIIPLPDQVIVYPGHGPGSACGKNIGTETVSTIGAQKQSNYALNAPGRDVFVKVVCEGIPPAPDYFSIAASINKNGYDDLNSVMGRSLKKLSVQDVKQLKKEGFTILDVRPPEEFEKGHIPGSVNIGLNGQFAIWAGTLLDYSKPLVLVIPAGKESETMVRLARVGLEGIRGYLDGGFDEWKNSGATIEGVSSIDPEDFMNYVNRGYRILDVRKPGEFESGHVKGAVFITLQYLENRISELNKLEPLIIHCAGGYRSMIAVSILRSLGFTNLINLRKGYNGIKSLPEISIEEGTCPTEKLKASLQV